MKKFLVCLFGLLTTSVAFGGYEKDLKYTHYWQDDPCWCSITIVEQWSDHVNKDSWDDRQESLAKEYGVKAYDRRKGECPTWGLNVKQMADALEDETPNWFNAYNTKRESTFASRIVKEIRSGQPVAIVGNTRYENGEVKSNQHYFLIDRFENTGKKYSSKYSKIKGFYLHDPAYSTNKGGPISPRLKATAPDTFVNKEIFFKSYASNSYRSRYYLVRDWCSTPYRNIVVFEKPYLVSRVFSRSQL